MRPILETEHLRLREFRQGDLDDLVRMVADPDQMRFYPRPTTRAEASAWINRNLGLYGEHGFGFWLIESLATKDFVGYCGIRPLDLEGRPRRRSGGILRSGSGTGESPRTLRSRRETWPSDGLAGRVWVAIVHADHLASRRVAENIGMRKERRTLLDDYLCVILATGARAARSA